MKNLILILSTIFLASCSNPYDEFVKNKELYEHTDYFVESLETTFESYGMLGGMDYQKVTSDGMYQITPVGRLINVKILEVVEASEYEELREELESHYSGDTRVNEVYISNGGTVMIDCRK
jgi:hypothetical protein